MKKFTIEEMRCYVLFGSMPKEATELELQRAIAETLVHIESAPKSQYSLLAFSCVGCRTPFAGEKLQSYVDMVGSGDPERMRTYDFHCERCAQAEAIRRQILPADTGEMFVLTAFDIDMISASGFQLGRADADSVEAFEKHYARVLAASLVRKVDRDSLVTEPPKSQKPNLKIVVREDMPAGTVALVDPNGVERLRVTNLKEDS